MGAAIVDERVHKPVHARAAASRAPVQVEEDAAHEREPVPRVREVAAQHQVKGAEGFKKGAIDEGHASSVAKHAAMSAFVCACPLLKCQSCDLTGHVLGQRPPKHAWIYARAEFTNAVAPKVP